MTRSVYQDSTPIQACALTLVNGSIVIISADEVYGRREPPKGTEC
jgi:hypothetical protein